MISKKRKDDTETLEPQLPLSAERTGSQHTKLARSNRH
jgi:hypothetical protein